MLENTKCQPILLKPHIGRNALPMIEDDIHIVLYLDSNIGNGIHLQ